MISSYENIDETDMLKRKYLILFPMTNLISLLIGYIIGNKNNIIIINNDTNSTM